MDVLGRHRPTMTAVQHDLTRALWLKDCGRGTESWHSLSNSIRSDQNPEPSSPVLTILKASTGTQHAQTSKGRSEWDSHGNLEKTLVRRISKEILDDFVHMGQASFVAFLSSLSY